MTAIDSDGRATTSARPGPPPAAAARRPRLRRGWYLPYALTLPAVVVLLGVLGYPLVRLVLLAFQNVNDYLHLADPALVRWIGVDGFTKVLTDGAFWQVVERTVLFTLEVASVSIVLGLAVAALLQRVSPWVKVVVVTSLMFVWAIPAIVTGTVFRWLFSNTGGAVDYLCYLLGGSGMLHHDWFANPDQGLYVVLGVVVLWGALPFLVLGFNAAMTQVPRELVEAARIDGASPVQTFRHVTLPIIRPFLLLATALSVIWDFQVFGQVWALRGNSPEQGYQVIGVYLYERGIGSSHYSASAVISLVMILLMLGALVFYIRQVIAIGEQD
jgi:N,N'-diacetylchitobiose transport system permease protein